MNNLTRLSVFNTRLDTLLQGVNVSEISNADRDLAVRHAMMEYNRNLPRRESAEFAGDGGKYYLLDGKIIDVAEADRDAGIDLTSSGADSKLGVMFALTRAMEIRMVNLWLSRTGATVEGEIEVALYTTSGSLPSQLIATSAVVDIDDIDGAPRGRYGRVQFPFPAEQVFELPAGTYCAVLQSSGYTYANGTNEVLLGVDQSGVTNTVTTHDGVSWTAYGTDSAGIIEVVGNLPGWREGLSSLLEVEYPAATLASEEQPQLLEPEDTMLFRSAAGTWLYFLVHSPASTDTVRVTFSRPYTWVEAHDAVIDTPEMHFEGICNLAAAVGCEWLATRYGQTRESSIAADGIERRSKSDVYLSLANRFRKAYQMLTGQAKGELGPGMAVVDVDAGPEYGRDFLFHRRSAR